jgi:hypothetical protein
MSLQNKNFYVDERVWIKGCGELTGSAGTILGCSSRHITDMYIVELDQPLPEHRAVVLPEGCLVRL